MTTRRTPSRKPKAPEPQMSFEDEVKAATAIVQAALQPVDAVIVIALRGNAAVMDAETDINQAAAMLTFANRQVEAAALKARLAEIGHGVE
jgi:hypothetical protein